MRTAFLRSAAFALGFIAFFAFEISAQKEGAADVIAKHRASIGTASALAAVKNQLVLSNAQFTLKGSAAVIGGKALVLSTSDKSLWGMNFNSNEYPQDRFGFDGKAIVGKATPSARSLLGDFLYSNRVILSEGLIGGTLSASWPLLNSGLRKAKIRHEGAKTINGIETVILSYSPKGGSDLVIRLYFDAKTYRHIRTEYTLARAAVQGSNIDNSAGQSGSIQRLVENFSSFTKMGELVLPGSHKMTYSRTGTASLATTQSANRDAEWTFTVTDIGFNRELDENSFNVEAK